MKYAIISLVVIAAFVIVSYLYFSSKRAQQEAVIEKIKTLPAVVDNKMEKPPAEIAPEVQTKHNTKRDENWEELNKTIAKIEEEINLDNYSSLEELKKLLQKNPNYPKKTQVEVAIQNWENEKLWSEITKKINEFEKKLNKGNYTDLEAVQQLMDENPNYPMKSHVETGIKRWRQELHFIEISKQIELIEYMCDKGIYSEIETIKEILQKNPDFPRIKHFTSKIKVWEHEIFLQNVPL